MKRLLIIGCIFFTLKASAQDTCVNKKKFDSIRVLLFTQSFKVNSVKVYLQICKKKPTSKKYLYTWINRIVN